MKRITKHSQHIKTINFDGYSNNNNISFFEWCPIFPKILILHNPINLEYTKIISNIEYIILINNDSTHLQLNNKLFPNLKFIGCYKTHINILNDINKIFVINFIDIGFLSYFKNQNLVENFIKNLFLTYKN